MGPNIDVKKIEDVTRRQVTFSKRRTTLMKMVDEISKCCGADVAFVAFSPAGRVSKFCSQIRVEDVIRRYVNSPPEIRFSHMSNVERKMEKLGALEHIKGESNKLQYLDQQIENIELQIRKRSLELQIKEAGLRDYVVDPEQRPSLQQLSWCERNLNQSLQRIIARKKCNDQMAFSDGGQKDSYDDIKICNELHSTARSEAQQDALPDNNLRNEDGGGDRSVIIQKSKLLEREDLLLDDNVCTADDNIPK